MCPRILWFLLPGVALVLKGEPLDSNVRPPNRGLAGRRSVRRLREDKIILTDHEIAQFTGEIKKLKSWDAVRANHQGDAPEMFKRIAFRNEHVVLPTLRRIKANHDLHITVPSLESIPGSRTTTSDFDVAIRVPKYKRDPNDDAVTAAQKFQDSLEHLGDDVKAASLFFDSIKEKFGAFSGTVFDSNIYVNDIPGGRFRKTSSAIRETQDIAALVKLRRYATETQFQGMLDHLDSFHNEVIDRHAADNGRATMLKRQFKESKQRFAKAVEKRMELQNLLSNKLKKLQSLDAGSDIGRIEADGNRVSEAEYALYLEIFTKVREHQIALEKIKLDPPEGAENRRMWNAKKQTLRDNISRLIADGVYFAPEAYSSEGAFGHIVKYEQAQTEEAKKKIYANLSPLDLLCSMNEQAGDFFKDVNFHFNDKPEIALYQSSKYLKRFYDAIDLLNRKVADWQILREWDPVDAPKWDPLDVRDIRTAIDPLYQIRKKSATVDEKKVLAADLVVDDGALGAALGRNVEEISQTLLKHWAKVNSEYRTNFGASRSAPPQSTGYELAINDENHGKVTTRTQDGESTTTKRLAKETPVSGASKYPESIVTVSLEVKKFASQMGDAIGSMTKSEIGEAMVAAKVSPELRRIMDAGKAGFRGLVAHAEHARRGRSRADVAPDVSTLNSGMFVLALSHVLAGTQQTHGGDSRALSNLQYALGLQMYVNLAGSALFVAADVAKFGALVELGVAQGALKPVEEMLSAIGKVESAAGGLLSLVNIGFDIYELTEARNGIERSMAINQLVVDSAGLALIGTSMALAATGAVVASQVLGAFLVPLAGLGIGVTALVGAFAKIGLQAGQVGLYFGKLQEGFQGGAYQLENGRYVPNPYSVIEKIDFQTLTVTMGSPYLSKSTHGSTGSGRINYFFWVGDQPRCNLRSYRDSEIMDPRMKWKKDVFDLRERMEKKGCKTCSATQRLPATSENQGELGKQNSPSVFVLPMSARSVIGYEYFILPGATTRQDYGFQILRDLEGDDFDFDFYVFPSEYIINHVHQYFLDTTVTLVMDDVHRILVTPTQERGTTGAWNKLSYHIVGSNNTTEIFLQNGVNFILTSPTSNPPVTFVLDSTLMDQQKADATIMEKTIIFDDLSIDFSTLPVESHVYLRSKEGLRRLDITGGIFLTESVNAPSNLRGSLQDVTYQVGKFTQKHRTAGRFVGVGGNIEGIEGHILYDTHENILVYTNDPTPSDTILLGVQSKEFGCFASPSQCRVWCTNLTTHEAILETKSFCSGTSGVTLGSFIFVAEKRAIIEITRVGKQLSNKESLHYRYLLSENDCSLVDIRHFAPIDNTSQDLGSALSVVPQWVDTPSKIGKSTRHIVVARVADWVAYERLLHGTASTPELNQRSWYHVSTKTTIILEKSKVNIPLENLTFMPLVSRTPSSRQSQPAILFHDSSSAQVFRYEPAPHEQGSGTLVLLRADIANVAQSGTAWFGVSSHGSVVEFLSAELFRIVGYTLNIFEENSLTQTHWVDWWTTLQAEDKASAPIIPFYQVESGLIKAMRSWYVRQANAYVILDHRFNENGTVDCVGVTENEADVLLVTETGVMWTAGVLRASDIADPFTNWKARKAPVEWTPSRHIHSEYKIVGAQWSAGGTTIETQTGLVILAHDLTTVSARFTLRGLRVSALADNALQLYHDAQHSQLQMPRANFVPVWVGDKQAYLLNVNNPTHIRLIVPNHQGVPLGVDDIKNKMVFFDAAGRVLWRDNVQLPSTFDFATRFGDVLLATSSQKQVFIPKLFGVKKIAVELKRDVKTLTIPHSYDQVNEVAVDTTSMAPTDVIEVQVPWESEELAQSLLHDVRNVDTTLQIVVLHASNKTLRWQGLPRQRLIVTFAPTGRAVSRSAVTEDDGSQGVLELSIIAATIGAVIIGIVAFILYKKVHATKVRQIPHE